MKSRCSFILKAGLAIVLCFILLVGTMTVGLAAIRDELAATGWATNTSGIYIHASVIVGGNDIVADNGWSFTQLKDEDGWQDFDIMTAGTYDYLVKQNDKWYGDKTGDNWAGNPTFSDGNGSNYVYRAHRNGDYDHGTDISAYFPKGQYVLKLKTNNDYDLYYYLYRKKAHIKYGWDSGSWTGYDMDYDGDGAYKYTITGNGSELRFRTNINDGDVNAASKYYYYYPSANDDIRDNVRYANGYSASSENTETSDNYWFIKTVNAATYTIWLKNGKIWVTVGGEPTSYYLTGNIDNADKTPISAIDSTLKFSASGTPGIYKLTKTFSADNGGYQYVTISDNTCHVYYPKINYGDSGLSASRTTPLTDADIFPVKGSDDASVDKWRVLAESGKTVTFTWDTTQSPPVLSWTIPTVTVYAKDGATNKDATSSTKYGFGAIAATTIVSVNGAAASPTSEDVGGAGTTSVLQKLRVHPGERIVIQTVISSTYKEKYYVKAFNINGVSHKIIKASSADTSGGVYTLTYDVPSDLTCTNIEITPIYYLINNSDTVTYYLEGFDSSLGWGDTVYAYPFYGVLYDIDNAFGTYPGQPFVNDNGTLSIEIPITNVPLSGNSGTSDANIIPVKGVTVSNGESDKVHKDLNAATVNRVVDERQTYDTDGFYKIYNEQTDSSGNKPNAIYQRIKLKTKRDNRETYGTAIPVDDDSSETDVAQQWGYTEEKLTPADSIANTDIVDIGENGNGWELYTDRYGRPIDIFGTVIGNTYSAATESATGGSALRVISTGYSSNISGDYGTAWLIYLPSGDSSDTAKSDATYKYASDTYTLLKDTSTYRYGMPPSILAIKNADHLAVGDSTYPVVDHRSFTDNEATMVYSDKVQNYSTMWSTLKTSWTGKYVYVSYESNQQKKKSSSERAGSIRLDSRWYYSFETDMVESKIEIEYWDGSAWVKDTVTAGNTGDNSGCSAYFTNAAFSGDMTTGSQLINTIDCEFTAAAGTGYKFDSWQKKDSDGGYTTLSTTNNSLTVRNNSSDVYVARFMPITAGNLNISHTASVADVANVQLRVEVHTTSECNDATPLYDSGLVNGSVLLDSTYISNTHNTYGIKVTLATTPYSLNTFSSWTYDEDFHKDKPSIVPTENIASATKISVFTFTVGNLFTGSDQDCLSLQYVSNVAVCDNQGKFRYRYIDRFGNPAYYDAPFYITAAEASSHPNLDDGALVGGSYPLTIHDKSSATTYADLAAAISARAPSSSLVNVYQETLAFALDGYTRDSEGSWDEANYGKAPSGDGITIIAKNAYTDNNNHAIVVMAREEKSTYTLTYHVGESLDYVSDVPYGTACEITENISTVGFLGWSTVEDDQSKIISPYRNFGLMLTKNTEVWAIYGEREASSWGAYIDIVSANREGNTAKLDILCRFSNNTTDAIPDGAEVGIIFLSGATDLSSFNNYTGYADALITKSGANETYRARLNPDPLVVAAIYKHSGGLSNFNRYYQQLTATYSSVAATNFVVYSYIKIGDSVYLSTPPVAGTFTGGPTN